MFGTGDGALTSLALLDPDKEESCGALRQHRGGSFVEDK